MSEARVVDRFPSLQMTEPKRTCRKSNGYVKHKKFPKPPYYSGQQGENERYRKKREQEHVQQVSRYGRAKQRQRDLH